MPARISRPVRQSIAKLHAGGARIADIARELNLARGTVARYVHEIDDDSAAASGLTADEVARLRFLATLAAPFKCAACGDQYFVLACWDCVFCDCGAEFRVSR